MTSAKRITEEECWFVIGAHQAGATERECSDLSGLSKTITHNIINNFKKQGSPHATKLSVNALLNASKPTNKVKSQQLMKNQAMKPRKRGRPPNPIEEPFFTEGIIRQVMYEARKSDQKKAISYSPPIYPLDRLNTPPSDEDSQHVKRQRRDSSIILTEELPPTPRSVEAMDESSDEENVYKKAQEQEWTIEEDEQLLTHILNLPLNNFKWKGLESHFGDRHMAKMCAERWNFLKKQLMKDMRTVIKEEKASVNSSVL